MREPVLVIMAAGMGSRFGGLKQITPVDDQGHSIIDYSLYDAWKAGFRKVVFIIKHEIEADFKRAVGSRMEEFFDVRYVVIGFLCAAAVLTVLTMLPYLRHRIPEIIEEDAVYDKHHAAQHVSPAQGGSRVEGQDDSAVASDSSCVADHQDVAVERPISEPPAPPVQHTAKRA